MPRTDRPWKAFQDPDRAIVNAFLPSWATVFGPPIFASREDERRAWNARGIRRAVWRRTLRMTIPAAAATFDGLSARSWDWLWGAITHTIFTLQDQQKARALIDQDRDAVRRFRVADPDAAASIEDCLRLWQLDLDAIERAAHIRAAHDGRYSIETFQAAHQVLRGPGVPYAVTRSNDAALRQEASRE